MRAGYVPTARVGPIMYTLIRQRWPQGGGIDVLAEKVGCDWKTVSGIIDQRFPGVSFDLADRILCALGRYDHWHGELADIYPTKFVETCALPSCNKTFPEQQQAGRLKRYCSTRCYQTGYAIRRGKGTGLRLHQRGYCLRGHKLTEENRRHNTNGHFECRACYLVRERARSKRRREAARAA